jgi:hypothetical protein
MKGLSLACVLALFSLFRDIPAQGQNLTLDSLMTGPERKSLDSLTRDLDDFLDYIYKEKSFFTFGMSAANGYYDFKTDNSAYLQAGNHLVLSPCLSYYHKSGFGFSASGYALDYRQTIEPYQLAISPSYAYLKSKDFATGIAYAHYFTKDQLPFYVTPLNNEWYGWVTLKKWWLEPTAAFGYAVGAQKRFQQEAEMVFDQAVFLRQERVPSIRIEDVALSFSLKHDFFLTHVMTEGGSMMVTPLLMLSSGTQNFGFNTSYTFNSHVINTFQLGSASTSATQNGFGLRSWTFILSGDYSLKGLFIQPQVVLDYYLADTNEKRFRYVTAITAGLNF